MEILMQVGIQHRLSLSPSNKQTFKIEGAS